MTRHDGEISNVRDNAAATGSRPARSPDVRECFNEDAISDLIVWNAPDHEHTRLSLRRQLEAELDDAFELYEAMGGDRAQGL